MTTESPPPDVPLRLRDYSPAQKFVYDKLRQMEPATQDQLAHQMQLPKRTVRDALSDLVEAGEVTVCPDTGGDARKKWYECAE